MNAPNVDYLLKLLVILLDSTMTVLYLELSPVLNVIMSKTYPMIIHKQALKILSENKLQNEAERYGLSIVPEARGRAFARIQAAEAYREEVVANAQGEVARFDKLLFEYQKAPKVTRDRLYLDAMQTLYSNSTKIMVDVEGGNNLMYLPIDKIIEQNKSQEDD